MTLLFRDLKLILEGLDDDAQVGVFVDGDPQGHSVRLEAFSERENIFWLRAYKEDDE